VSNPRVRVDLSISPSSLFLSPWSSSHTLAVPHAFVGPSTKVSLRVSLSRLGNLASRLFASSIASERRASDIFSAFYATFPFRLALETCSVHTHALQPAPATPCISLLCLARLFCPLHASYPKLYALRPVVTTIPDTHHHRCQTKHPLTTFRLVYTPQALDTFSSLFDYIYKFFSLCCITNFFCSRNLLFISVMDSNGALASTDGRCFLCCLYLICNQHHASAWCQVMNSLKLHIVASV
jgi:hypothetical protein